jgi:cyclic 2,3-diphosphoglycerate synthetase
LRRATFIIDGEHYVETTKDAISFLEIEFDVEAVGAGMVGEMNKFEEKALAHLDMPVVRERTPEETLKVLIERFKPDVVFDLTDIPLMSAQMRLKLASYALDAGVEYSGADFSFIPRRIMRVRLPAVKVSGLSKRSGKTAVSVRMARLAVAAGRKPILFTMGRGGPKQPFVLRPKRMEVKELVRLADEGVHSAGDLFESSIFSNVTVIGCRRAGGGISASVFHSNLGEGIKEAEKLDGDLFIFEGSGTTEPPVECSSILLVPSSFPLSAFDDPFVQMRIRRAKIATITAAEAPFASVEHISQLKERLLGLNSKIDVCATVFRPKPAENIEGMKVVVATTAREDAFNIIWRHLEDVYKCSVVVMTGALSNKIKLRDELSTVFKEKTVDTLVVELKAASIEVGARLAISAGKKVVLMENLIEDVKDWKPTFEEAFRRFLDEHLR